MERYAETFFRHKWVLLFVLIAIPLLGSSYAYKHRARLYQSTATVWAEKPLYLNTVGDWNQWNTPAQNQAGNVGEYVQTTSFAEEVLNQTDLKPEMQTPAGRAALISIFQQQTSIKSAGTHLVSITYSDQNPRVAAQVVSAIIVNFNKDVLASADSQGTSSLAFYQQQLDAANKQLADATAALRAYLTAHPELLQGSPNQPDSVSQLLTNGAFAAQHPEVVQLLQQQQSATQDQQRLQAKVDDIKFSQQSNQIGQEQTFRVMDAPKVPSRAISSLKSLGMQVGLSVGAGLAFTAIGLILATLLDASVRSEWTAAARFKLPVYGTLPSLPERRPLLRRGQLNRRNVRRVLALEARTPALAQTAARD